ncbi:MerR family transcriptional regulator [Klenkia sp. LSe6-5]|uniref:MerR family transcriptional regulator n=1 Tax=Klenkia sesuvii TaxID=3103137 RepID=A0ABU8DUM8_9ACTN
MRIGRMAALSGASPRSLRHYEDVGLLRPARSPSGQRVYEAADVDRVITIQHLLAGGLGTAVVKDLLPCLDAPAHERTGHLQDRLREEVERLEGRRRELARQVAVLGDLLAEQPPPGARGGPGRPVA